MMEPAVNLLQATVQSLKFCRVDFSPIHFGAQNAVAPLQQPSLVGSLSHLQPETVGQGKPTGNA